MRCGLANTGNFYITKHILRLVLCQMVTVQYTTSTNESLCENVFVMTSMSVNCFILTYMTCFTSLLLSLRALIL